MQEHPEKSGLLHAPSQFGHPKFAFLRAQIDFLHGVVLVVASDVGKKVAVARDVPRGAVSYA